MIAMLALLLAGDKPPAPPLQPSGKWEVSYRDTSCILSRRFGQGDDEVTVGWLVIPLLSRAELLISQRSGRSDFVRGSATVSTSRGDTVTETFASYPTQTPGRRMTRFSVAKKLFTGLPADGTVTIVTEKKQPLTLAMTTSAAAFEAVEKCNDDTLRVLKIDPAIRRSIGSYATPVQGEEQERWVRPEDYPTGANMKGQQGSTTILYTITKAGSVSGCRTVISSGSTGLDDAACAAVTRRARFVPARNLAGEVIDSPRIQKVDWSLPGVWQKLPSRK